ncbi:MAG: cob(I)yrinic acid a,c-diamide adenosyltransferase [Ruminococcus sp.]|uniref:cob(I)yrinic acid a,c-diamide adenosyltransferase n=1 Tax=Ruminococcus sp. TaxID=41978 RepID=UPI0025FDD132|nr:cob(I)yrinic acid a,c-diamide adenosyltransferase [Ruminococcus sp.]MCR5601822.1 cob(I)yrinic acid a,c-diamide adenosyltransferase [Ruminococcus sp.]
MIHIYYGNGKGKTTAAVGLAVRAVGAGMNVGFFQFLKNGNSSEISVLKSLGSIAVMCCEECNKFTFAMNEGEKRAVTHKHTEMLKKASAMIESGDVQLIVLDEFIDAYNKKMIDTDLAERFISDTAKKCEVVMTGREPSEMFRGNADYITEMSAVKHPYEKGITARKGIEY